MAKSQILTGNETLQELLESANSIKMPRTAAKPFLPNLTDDELRSLAREKLSEALQAIDAVSEPEMTRKLCAEVKDRLEGKPAQAMTLDANMKVINVNATVTFVPARIDNKIIEVVDNIQVIDN